MVSAMSSNVFDSADDNPTAVGGGEISMACASHIGRVRAGNEDSVTICPELNLTILADGMGGHNAGEVASRLAIRSLRNAIQAGESLYGAMISAHNNVRQAASESLGFDGMGTTLIAGVYDDKRVEIATIGDSRVYQYRDQELRQLSRDQTLAQQMRDENWGEEVEGSRRYEHILTSAVGIESLCKPVVLSHRFYPGDIHLYCSDGLTGCVSDDHIAMTLLNFSDSLEDCAQALLRAALQNGAPDNVTVSLVKRH